MPDKTIAIITGWEGIYGSGHLQRMLSLIWYINTRPGLKAVLWSDFRPGGFPPELAAYIEHPFTSIPDLIIHDKRDSCREYMKNLKKTAPVLTIDDLGEGREFSDFSLYLLPLPENKKSKLSLGQPEFFIYGYNFIKNLNESEKREIIKSRDFFIYLGQETPGNAMDRITGLLPAGCSYVIVGRGNIIIGRDGQVKINTSQEYFQHLCASKVLISHFGITLYEARIAGCKLITVNPTPYHSELAHNAPEYLEIQNLGTFDSMNTASAKEKIAGTLISSTGETVNLQKTNRIVRENLDSFLQYLNNLME